MKIKAESPEDFGITCTGEELESFNSGFVERFSKNVSSSVGTKIEYCIVVAVLFVFNFFIVFKLMWSLYTIAIVMTLTFALLGAFIYSYFISDRVVKNMTQNMVFVTASINSLLTGISAIVGDFISKYFLYRIIEDVVYSHNSGTASFAGNFKLRYIPFIVYLLLILIFIISLFIGMNTWGKWNMKHLNVFDKAAQNDGKHARSRSLAIAFAIAFAVVLVVAGLLADSGARVFIVLSLCAVLIAILVGWAIGIGITNIRYWKFLHKQKL